MIWFWHIIRLILVPTVFAASFTLQSDQNTIDNPNTEFVVNTSLFVSVADNSNYYLRGVFYKPGTSNYCGYTWNGNTWYKGPNSGWANFLPITVFSSTWSGQLKAKIDPEDTACNSSGKYNFKIQRFKDSDNGEFYSQNELSIDVIIPTITSTPSINPSLTPTSIPTIISTNTPTPKITLIPTNTIKNNPTNTSKPSIQSTQIPVPTQVPDTEVLSAQSEIPVKKGTQTKTDIDYKMIIIPITFISLGLALISGVLVYQKIKNTKMI